MFSYVCNFSDEDDKVILNLEYNDIAILFWDLVNQPESVTYPVWANRSAAVDQSWL